MVGVDAKDEPIRVGSRVGQHEPTVTGAKVHRRRGVRRGDIGQLTDVHLGQAASRQESHEPMIANGR